MSSISGSEDDLSDNDDEDDEDDKETQDSGKNMYVNDGWGEGGFCPFLVHYMNF